MRYYLFRRSGIERGWRAVVGTISGVLGGSSLKRKFLSLIFSAGEFAQFFAYHIVFTMGVRRIFLSRVTKARPSARAVAAIIRSAGSAEKSPGNCVESTAIIGVISFTTTPLVSTSSPIHVSGVPRGERRPRAINMAISHRLMEAIPIPPEDTALRIALAAERESRLGSRQSHSST